MRSKLFVPGSRPEWFAEAFASAADAISFDLEDSVAVTRKDTARASVADAVGERLNSRRQTIIVRVNPLRSALFLADIEAVAGAGLDVVNLPKLEGPEDVRTLAGHLQRLETERRLPRTIGILANIETPRSLRQAAAIAAADPRVIGLQIGFGDLFEAFGISRRTPIALANIWMTVRMAAAESQLPAYDGAFVDVADQAGFLAEAQEARRFGFAGKSCIHPSQITIANTVFGPTGIEIAHAMRVLRAAEENLAAGVGAFMLDGVMIDEPYIARARAIVALGARDMHV